jgi:hypothetical protein
MKFALILFLLLSGVSLLEPNPNSMPLDQKQRIQEALTQIGDNMTRLQEFQQFRTLSYTFLQTLKMDEKQYKDLEKELGSSDIKKGSLDQLENKVNALLRQTDFKVTYFELAPKTSNASVQVKAHTSDRGEPKKGYDVFCWLVGEKYKDNPRIESFPEPSTPTPRKDDEWKPMDAGLYDCWCEDSGDKSKKGSEKECRIGDRGAAYTNCYVQIP